MQPTCIPKRKRSRESRLPYRFVRKPGAASQEQPGAARSSQLVLSAWGCGALHHLPQVVRHAMQRWESTARFRSSPRCDVYEFIVDPDKPDPPEADTCVCPLGHGHFRFLPRPCIPTEFIHARPETAKEKYQDGSLPLHEDRDAGPGIKTDCSRGKTGTAKMR